jgi:hypothetical protein
VQDSAFIIGRQGACKMKIARASGAKLDLRDGRLTITGTPAERKRARKYVNLVKQQVRILQPTCVTRHPTCAVPHLTTRDPQRLGPVYADVKDIDDGDLVRC